MSSKAWLVFLLLALAMVAETYATIDEFSSTIIEEFDSIISNGDADLIVDDNEFLMSSESTRRSLMHGHLAKAELGTSAMQPLEVTRYHAVGVDVPTTIAAKGVGQTLTVVVALPSHIVPETPVRMKNKTSHNKEEAILWHVAKDTLDLLIGIPE